MNKRRRLCSLRLENCQIGGENTFKDKKLCSHDCTFQCAAGSTPICGPSCRLTCRPGCRFTNNLTNPFSIQNCCRCLCQGIDTVMENPNWIKNIGSNWAVQSSCRCICDTKKQFCDRCVCPLGVGNRRDDSGTCQQGCASVKRSLCTSKMVAGVTCSSKCRLRCDRGLSPGCGDGCELFCWKNCPFKGRESNWRDYQKCCKCLCYKKGNGPWINTVNHSAIILADDAQFRKHCGCECDPDLFNDCSKEPWCYRCNCPLGLVPSPVSSGKPCRTCPEECVLVKKDECKVANVQGAFCDKDCRLSCAVDISPGCNTGCELVCLPGCLFRKFNVQKRDRPKCCTCICRASTGNRWLEQVNWDALVRYKDEHFMKHCGCDCDHGRCMGSKNDTACTKCTCPLINYKKSNVMDRCRIIQRAKCQSKHLGCPSHCRLKCPSARLNDMKPAEVTARCRCECSPSPLVCQQQLPHCYSCVCLVHGTSSRMLSHHRSPSTDRMYCVKCRPFCRLTYNTKCSANETTIRRNHVCDAGCTFHCEPGSSGGCPPNCELTCDHAFSPFIDFKNDFTSRSKCRCICNDRSKLKFQALKVDWTKHLSSDYGNCTCYCPQTRYCQVNLEDNSNCNQCRCKIHSRRNTAMQSNCKLSKAKPCDNNTHGLHGTCGLGCALSCMEDPALGCSPQCHLVCWHDCAFIGNSSRTCCTCSCNKHGHAWMQPPNFNILLKAQNRILTEKCECNCMYSTGLCNGVKLNSLYECTCPLEISKRNVTILQRTSQCRLRLEPNGGSEYLACTKDCRLKCESGSGLGCGPGCSLVCLPNCPILGPYPRRNARNCCKCKCGGKKESALGQVDWMAFEKAPFSLLKNSCTCVCRPIKKSIAKYWAFGSCIKCVCPLIGEAVQSNVPKDYQKFDSVLLNPICTKNCTTVVTKSCSYRTNLELKCPKRCSFVCKSAGVQVGCPTSCSFVCKAGCPFMGSLLNITDVSSCCGCECSDGEQGGMTKANWNVVSNVHRPLWDIMCRCECPPITDTCPDRLLALACYGCSCPTLNEPPEVRAILSASCPSCSPADKCKAHLKASCKHAIVTKYMRICPLECSFECAVGRTSACPINCRLVCNEKNQHRCRCLCKDLSERAVSWLQVLTEPNLAESCSCKCPVVAKNCLVDRIQPDCYHCKCPTLEGVISNATNIPVRTTCLSCLRPGCVVGRNELCQKEFIAQPKALCNRKCMFACQRGRSPGCGLNCRLECYSNCPFHGNKASEEEVRRCCRCACTEHYEPVKYKSVNYAAIISTKSFHSYCKCSCRINSWECAAKQFNDACYRCECPLNTSGGDRSSTVSTRDDWYSCIKCPNDTCVIQSDSSCSNQIQPARFCGKTCQLKCLKGQSPGCSLHCSLKCDENCPFYGSRSRESRGDKCCKCLCDDGSTSWHTPINWAAILSTKTFAEHCYCDCTPQLGKCISASIDSDCYKCMCPLYSGKTASHLDSYTPTKCLSCPDDDCKVLTHRECRHDEQTRHQQHLRHFDPPCNGTFGEDCNSWLHLDVWFLDAANHVAGPKLCDKDCGIRCSGEFIYPICDRNCNLTCLPNCPFSGQGKTWELARRCCSCKCPGRESSINYEKTTAIKLDESCDCLCPPSHADCTAQNVRINCYDCVCPTINSTRIISRHRINSTNSCLGCGESCFLDMKWECEVRDEQNSVDNGKKSRKNGNAFSSENMFFYAFRLEKFEEAVIATAGERMKAEVVDVRKITEQPFVIDNLPFVMLTGM